jgi:hypothetical protein
MSPSQLLPVAAATLSFGVRNLQEIVEDGLSFARWFQIPPAADAASPVPPRGSDAVTLPPTGRIDHLARLVEQELEAFLERFQMRLHQQRLDTSEPVELKVGASGELVVENHHSQRSAIEELIGADPELSLLFRRTVAAVSAYQRAADPAAEMDREIRVRIEQGHGSIEIE